MQINRSKFDYYVGNLLTSTNPKRHIKRTITSFPKPHFACKSIHHPPPNPTQQPTDKSMHDERSLSSVSHEMLSEMSYDVKVRRSDASLHQNYIRLVVRHVILMSRFWLFHTVLHIDWFMLHRTTAIRQILQSRKF